MTSPNRIYRFESDAPSGLTATTLALAEFHKMPNTQSLDAPREPFPSHDVARVRENEVPFVETDATERLFDAAEVFFAPAVMACSRHVPSDLRKSRAALDPSIRPDHPPGG
jgi:hypothetical protein